MRKRDIFKFVFVVLLTAAAVFACVTAVSIRRDIDAAQTNANNAGEAIGYAFGAAFGMIAAILFAGGALLAGLVAVILCAFGLRAPVRWVKFTFLSFLLSNVIIGIIAVAGTLAGL